MGISFATILPWGIVSVFDAIDSKYRRIGNIVIRLVVSLLCNTVAYIVGIWFVVRIVEDSNALSGNTKYDRFDEVATFLVLLFFNLWFAGRNFRGWVQLLALRRLRFLFMHMQQSFNLAAQRNGAVGKMTPIEEGLFMLRVSDRLINNDLNTPTPFLNPLNLRTSQWKLAAWRAWWTQNCSDHQSFEILHYDPECSLLLAAEFPDKGPRWPNGPEEVHQPRTGQIIPRGDKDAWKNALMTYSPGGQQDTKGPPNLKLFSVKDRSGIATLVHEKTHIRPHRMASLWYSTARFEDLCAIVASDINARSGDQLMMPEAFAIWKDVASDIAQHLKEPMYLNGVELCIYAGELASASILLSHFPTEFSDLVEQVYQDGRSSRWTFGWSGLLACFSNLWTRQRVFITMLSGLSLLAIKSANNVASIEPSVRAMMVGYASFAISERAIGKRIAKERKDELLARYMQNRGKTCRGSGLCATRLACSILGIPAAASHMDGLPAFATGWALEFMEFRPGNQLPEHGGNHHEVEEREGSSTAWRYPESHN